MNGYLLLFIGVVLIFAVVTGRGHKLWDALTDPKSVLNG